jgi:predicted transcriptional regulator
MTKPSKRTTVYFDPDLYKALRLKAIAVSKSISDIINQAVRDSLKNDRRKYNAILQIMSAPGLKVTQTKNKT